MCIAGVHRGTPVNLIEDLLLLYDLCVCKNIDSFTINLVYTSPKVLTVNTFIREECAIYFVYKNKLRNYTAGL